jgi:hypothetical protein
MRQERQKKMSPFAQYKIAPSSSCQTNPAQFSLLFYGDGGVASTIVLIFIHLF